MANVYEARDVKLYVDKDNRLRVICPVGKADPPPEGFKELKGFHSCNVAINDEDIVKAYLEIDIGQVSLSGAVPVFGIQHPETGEAKEVESITFKDGTTWQTG